MFLKLVFLPKHQNTPVIFSIKSNQRNKSYAYYAKRYYLLSTVYVCSTAKENIKNKNKLKLINK